MFFTGSLEVANMSRIRNTILHVVQAALLEVFVIPNLMVVDYSWDNLDKEDRIVRFENMLPQAVLRLQVREARRLHGADYSIIGPGHSDPYAVITLGLDKYKTHTIKRTCNPKWNETFDLLLYDPRQHLSLTIYDQDFASQDDLLGRVKNLPVGDIIKAASDGLWVRLIDTPEDDMEKDDSVGEAQVCLEAKALDLCSDRKRLESLAAAANAASLGELSKQKTKKRLPSMFNRKTVKHENSMDNYDYDKLRKTKTNLRASKPKGWETVAMLVCRLVSGKVAEKLGSADSVQLEVGVNKTHEKRTCADRWYGKWETVSEDVQEVIERLAKRNMGHREIAEIVKRPPHIVKRIMDKRLGFNLEILQRLCLLLGPEDLHATTPIKVGVYVKGHLEASATVSMAKTISGVDNVAIRWTAHPEQVIEIVDFKKGVDNTETQSTNKPAKLRMGHWQDTVDQHFVLDVEKGRIRCMAHPERVVEIVESSTDDHLDNADEENGTLRRSVHYGMQLGTYEADNPNQHFIFDAETGRIQWGANPEMVLEVPQPRPLGLQKPEEDDVAGLRMAPNVPTSQYQRFTLERLRYRKTLHLRMASNPHMKIDLDLELAIFALVEFSADKIDRLIGRASS